MHPVATLDEVRAANDLYADTFTKGHLPMPPGRKFAVVACMDARLDPAKYAGLSEGDRWWVAGEEPIRRR